MEIQHIELSGQPFVIIPKGDYERMVELDEMADDVATFNAIMAARDPDEEALPLEFCEELFAATDAGQPLIPIWRKYRGLTQAELAKAAGVTQAYISDIESGKKEGGITTLKAIAQCLGCDLDDLV